MNKKILVVEDEPYLTNLLTLRLQAAHYEVITAADGEEGLEKIRREKPDLVIVDIIMPKMDGYSFVKHLRRESSAGKTPVIVLTAWDKMEELFHPEGIQDYIVKPFQSEELLAKVRKYLGNGGTKNG